MQTRPDPEKSVSAHTAPELTGPEILTRGILAIGEGLKDHLTDIDWIVGHRLAIQPLLESVYEERRKVLGNVLILTDLVTMVDALRDRLDAALRAGPP